MSRRKRESKQALFGKNNGSGLDLHPVMTKIPIIQKIILYASKRPRFPLVCSNVCQSFKETIITHETALLAWTKQLTLLRKSKSRSRINSASGHVEQIEDEITGLEFIHTTPAESSHCFILFVIQLQEIFSRASLGGSTKWQCNPDDMKPVVWVVLQMLPLCGGNVIKKTEKSDFFEEQRRKFLQHYGQITNNRKNSTSSSSSSTTLDVTDDEAADACPIDMNYRLDIPDYLALKDAEIYFELDYRRLCRTTNMPPYSFAAWDDEYYKDYHQGWPWYSTWKDDKRDFAEKMESLDGETFPAYTFAKDTDFLSSAVLMKNSRKRNENDDDDEQNDDGDYDDDYDDHNYNNNNNDDDDDDDEETQRDVGSISKSQTHLGFAPILFLLVGAYQTEMALLFLSTGRINLDECVASANGRSLLNFLASRPGYDSTLMKALVRYHPNPKKYINMKDRTGTFPLLEFAKKTLQLTEPIEKFLPDFLVPEFDLQIDQAVGTLNQTSVGKAKHIENSWYRKNKNAPADNNENNAFIDCLDAKTFCLGTTALIYAARSMKPELAEVLMANGANGKDVKDSAGKNALYYAKVFADSKQGGPEWTTHRMYNAVWLRMMKYYSATDV